MLLVSPRVKSALALGFLGVAAFFGRGAIGNFLGGVGDYAGRSFNAVDVTNTPVCIPGAYVQAGTDYDTHAPRVRIYEQPNQNGPVTWSMDVPGATKLNKDVRLVYVDRGCQPDNNKGGLVAITFEGQDKDGRQAVETVVYDVGIDTGAQVVADQVNPVSGNQDAVSGTWQLAPDVRSATYTLQDPNGQVLNQVQAPLGDPANLLQNQ